MSMDTYKDIGRNYTDKADADPSISTKALPQNPWASTPTQFIIKRKEEVFKQTVYYSHLALLKMCKEYEFDTVLDIGSGTGEVSNVFKLLDKKVTALEPNPDIFDQPLSYAPDNTKDYFDVHFEKQFDAIWASHVLEHVRNPGSFLEKIYNDLKPGGVLAITVPFMDFSSTPFTFYLGHHNKYTDINLLYQLICAGFNCQKASIKIYCGQVSVILKKEPSNIIPSNTAIYAPAPGQEIKNLDKSIIDITSVPTLIE